MANVHGFGEIRDNDRVNYQPAQGADPEAAQMAEQMQNFAEIQSQLPLLGNSSQRPPDPRRESFWDMLKQACCPSFQWASFIIFITAIDIIIYIASLASGWSSSDEFLGPKDSTLLKWGAKCAYDIIERGEIYRWIMPLFLHASFLHILFNATAQLIIGFQLEKTANALRTMGIYLVSGIGGVLFSALVTDDSSVGASTAIFGLIGAIFGYFIMNWRTLDIIGGMMKCCMCCILIIMLVYLLFFTLMMSNIDGWGHLGGFLTGLPMGFLVLPVLTPPRRQNTREELNYVKIWRIVGGVALLLWLVLGFSLFYTQRHPFPCIPKE